MLRARDGRGGGGPATAPGPHPRVVERGEERATRAGALPRPIRRPRRRVQRRRGVAVVVVVVGENRRAKDGAPVGPGARALGPGRRRRAARTPSAPGGRSRDPAPPGRAAVRGAPRRVVVGAHPPSRLDAQAPAGGRIVKPLLPWVRSRPSSELLHRHEWPDAEWPAARRHAPPRGACRRGGTRRRRGSSSEGSAPAIGPDPPLAPSSIAAPSPRARRARPRSDPRSCHRSCHRSSHRSCHRSSHRTTHRTMKKPLGDDDTAGGGVRDPPSTLGRREAGPPGATIHIPPRTRPPSRGWTRCWSA